MKKAFLMVASIATISFAEVSAFDAGNINDGYGLTPNEKILKDKFDSLNTNNLELEQKINETQERLNGIQSILEGVNSQYTKSNSRLQRLEDLEENLSSELQNLKAYAEESRAIQQKNHEQIKKILSELVGNDLKMNFDEQNLTQTKKDDNKTRESKENKTTIKDDSWKKKDPDDLLKIAMKEFESKDKLQDAKEKFEYLVSKNYKPARSNFYIAEIEYKQKNYANAIGYYKKSSVLFAKSKQTPPFMPTLLYHTAISLDKVGDTKNANVFYKALKADYPNSKEAKASPNRK